MLLIQSGMHFRMDNSGDGDSWVHLNRMSKCKMDGDVFNR